MSSSSSVIEEMQLPLGTEPPATPDDRVAAATELEIEWRRANRVSSEPIKVPKRWLRTLRADVIDDYGVQLELEAAGYPDATPAELLDRVKNPQPIVRLLPLPDLCGVCRGRPWVSLSTDSPPRRCPACYPALYGDEERAEALQSALPME